MNAHWFFIINPISGKGQGNGVWHKLKPLLTSSDIPFSFAVSEYHRHTLTLVAEKYAQGVRHFIGLGGDGTLNEMVNGVLSAPHYLPEAECVFGLLPVGTGNDWIKSRPEKLTVDNILEKLKNPQVLPHDVGVLTSDSFSRKSYFINVAGAGLDGRVSQELEKLSAKSAKAKAAYLRGLLKALFTFHAPNCTVRVGHNEIFNGRALVVTAAKGQFFGNGMHISPNALPANGLFDFTIVQKVPNWKIFPQLPKLFSGKLDSASFVQKREGQALEIHSEFAMPVQADGEFVGEAKAVSFQVLAEAIQVLT